MRRVSGRSGAPTGFAAAFASLVLAAAASGQYRIPEPQVSATRAIRRATVPQRDSSHLLSLTSLRQMRDPELESFYRRLLQAPDWQIQVHALLGLAELGPLDPFLLQRIDPRGQELVIAHALDHDMIDVETSAAILQWSELEPMARLLLLGEAILAGRPVPEERLQRLSTSGNLQVAALASCMLVQVDDSANLSAYRERLGGLSRRDREQHLAWLAEGIRQYELDKSLPLVTEALDGPRPSRGLITGGILTSLQLDPGNGLVLWRRFYDPAGRDSQKVRFALLLTVSARDVGPAGFVDAPTGSELIDAISNAGRAMADDRTDPVPALCALLDTGHLKSTDWVLSECRDLPEDRAAAVYNHLIDSVVADAARSAGRIAYAVKAVTRLFEIDPDAVIKRLQDPDTPELAQQALLLGLFESTSPRVRDAVRGVPRIGPRRTDSMALILLARHEDEIADEDLHRLSTIAAGGGRVSEMLQVQAAWLYLEHSGLAEKAMAEIFSDS